MCPGLGYPRPLGTAAEPAAASDRRARIDKNRRIQNRCQSWIRGDLGDFEHEGTEETETSLGCCPSTGPGDQIRRTKPSLLPLFPPVQQDCDFTPAAPGVTEFCLRARPTPSPHRWVAGGSDLGKGNYIIMTVFFSTFRTSRIIEKPLLH